MFSYYLSSAIVKIDKVITNECIKEFGIHNLFECKLNIYLLCLVYFVIFPSLILLIIRNIVKRRKFDTFFYIFIIMFLYFY